MSNTFKESRHKIEDRKWFTEDFRERIAAKSDHNCVCCGKKKYFGYGATIDHFVPISKGGTNEEVNLVMMCEECNKKKTNLIIPPMFAAKYLSSSHKKELEDYFIDYLKKYRYMHRGNLLACDVYNILLVDPALVNIRRKKRNTNDAYDKLRSHWVRRAVPDDEDRLCEYLTKYFKKYDCLDSEQLVRENIKFWMKFGAIYYVETNEKLSIVAPIVINSFPAVSMYLFSYYSTPQSAIMCRGLLETIMDGIVEENDIPYITMMANMFVDDELVEKVFRRVRCVTPQKFAVELCYYDNRNYGPDPNALLTEENKKIMSDFFKSFQNITDKARQYLYDNNLYDNLCWMIDEIKGPFVKVDAPNGREMIFTKKIKGSNQ